MKRIRVILILITLVCYYIFFAIFSDIRNSKELNQNDKLKSKINHFSDKDVRVKRINYGSVMDPTPIPPLPPNVERDTQLLD